MKKYIYTISVIMLTSYAAMFTSCKKEEISQTETPIKQEKVTTKNGVLTFSDNDAFNETLNMLGRMNPTELKKWEDAMGFRSQQTLYNEMIAAEQKQEELIYAGQNPDLNRAQLAALGFEFEHSPEFIALERQGLVKETLESDGNYSISLTLSNPALAFVTNAKGEVNIAEYKHVYAGTQVKLLDANEALIAEYDIESRITNGWSTTSGWRNDPYNGSGRRVQTVVTATSSSLPNTLCNVVHTYAVQAQRLMFGTWAYRNSYNPIYSASGSFSYSYTLTNGSFTNNLNSGGGYASPFSYTIGSTNLLVLTLKPNGLWNTSPNVWVSTVDALSYSYYASFLGGSNGWALERNSPNGADGGWTYYP